MSDTPDGAFAKRRSIRSFIIREGRLTRGQARALDSGWPLYGIEYSAEPTDLRAAFKDTAHHPLTLEIGFGNGEALFEMAKRNTDQNFVGIEVHRPGVGHLLMLLQEAALQNARVINHDAMDVLEHMVADHTFNRINLYFPDPWPKKKHHKRRIVQPSFLALLHRRLAPGGRLHFATDWHPYAEHMCAVLQSSALFRNTRDNATAAHDATPDDVCVPRPDSRPLTKFEKRGHRKGHGVWDFIFERVDN
ncbi:MAG: tRNA (guanosine(46)-N7)-methyltransferase TrmB [Pseudomonadota bacterium]